MTIRQTAYDTSAGNAYAPTVAKIKPLLEEIIYKDYTTARVMETSKGEFEAGVITGVTPAQNNIPPFAHAIIVPKKNGDHQHGNMGNVTVFADYRIVAGRPKEHSMPPIVHQIEYRMLRLRHLLSMQWLALNPSIFRDVSVVPASVYAAWVSEGVSRRFGLDPKEQQQIAIIAACFYQTLFSDDKGITKDNHDKYEAAAIKATRAPFALVTDTVNQIGEHFSTLAEMCEVIRRILDNPRLNDLHSGIVIMMLNNSWFGANARDILSAAIEHPPTWISVVYFALLERTYRNSGVQRIAERYAKSKGGDAFLRSLDNICEDYKGFTSTFFDGA